MIPAQELAGYPAVTRARLYILGIDGAEISKEEFQEFDLDQKSELKDFKNKHFKPDEIDASKDKDDLSFESFKSKKRKYKDLIDIYTQPKKDKDDMDKDKKYYTDKCRTRKLIFSPFMVFIVLKAIEPIESMQLDDEKKKILEDLKEFTIRRNEISVKKKAAGYRLLYKYWKGKSLDQKLTDEELKQVDLLFDKTEAFYKDWLQLVMNSESSNFETIKSCYKTILSPDKDNLYHIYIRRHLSENNTLNKIDDLKSYHIFKQAMLFVLDCFKENGNG